jgi:hypothetical protein
MQVHKSLAVLHVQIQKTANVDRSRQRYNEVQHGSPSACGLLVRHLYTGLDFVVCPRIDQ